MTHLRRTLLLATLAFAITANAQTHVDPQWKQSRSDLFTAYKAFIHAASIDDSFIFSLRMNDLLNATTALVHTKDALAAQPGAAQRDAFTKTAVGCQAAAIRFWHQTSASDPNKKGIPAAPLPSEVVTCMKELSQPD